MKPIIKTIAVFAAILFFFTACRSNDDSQDNNGGNGLSDIPLAKATYDNSNFGIYKGVFVGSTGSILININNDGQIKATLVIAGSTQTFTTNTTVTQGQEATIHFTSGNDFFDFHLRANGVISSSDISNVQINGHPNAAIVVLKEQSDGLARVYEGTFEGGTFNFVVQKNTIQGVAQNTQLENLQLSGLLSGTNINNGVFNGNQGSNGSFTGAISGNSANGTWHENGGNSGTWKGTRTL